MLVNIFENNMDDRLAMDRNISDFNEIYFLTLHYNETIHRALVPGGVPVVL